MGSLIDPEGLNQHKYYGVKEQAADNCMYGFSKKHTMFLQQDSTTKKADECPETGHWWVLGAYWGTHPNGP